MKALSDVAHTHAHTTQRQSCTPPHVHTPLTPPSNTHTHTQGNTGAPGMPGEPGLAGPDVGCCALLHKPVLLWLQSTVC